MEIASLWFDIDAPAVAPPTVTRQQVLPLASLSWENFERLCFRLAHRCGEVEDARIYGERGQAQEGIDLYVRRATGDYETWQCKRYEQITTTDIKEAVTKFLEGNWESRTRLFRLAVAPSLNAIKLAEEIERQRQRCEAVNITFEPLDRDRLSLMLKDHPDLVDDFLDANSAGSKSSLLVVSSWPYIRLTSKRSMAASRRQPQSSAAQSRDCRSSSVTWNRPSNL